MWRCYLFNIYTVNCQEVKDFRHICLSNVVARRISIFKIFFTEFKRFYICAQWSYNKNFSRFFIFIQFFALLLIRTKPVNQSFDKYRIIRTIFLRNNKFNFTVIGGSFFNRFCKHNYQLITSDRKGPLKRYRICNTSVKVFTVAYFNHRIHQRQ